MSDDQAEATSPSQPKPIWKKGVVLVVVLAIAAICYWLFRDWLSIDYLAQREQQLRDYQANNPIFVYGIAFVAYALITGFSLPIAAVTTLAYGWLFGFGPALVLVSFASTLGATFSFLVSRYLFRDFVQTRFGETLSNINQALEREGQFYLFTLRLIPVVPFFVINLVMGLTPMRVWTYWWVSQLGMLPGTAVYVWAGSELPNLNELAENVESGKVGEIFNWQLLLAFALLGIFPLVVKKLMGWIRKQKDLPQTPNEPSQSDTEEGNAPDA